MKMRPCLFGLIVLSAVFSGTGIINATITVIPSVVVTLINDTAVFNCSTTSAEVEWIFGSNQYSQLVIYSYGKVKPTYVDRFSVQNYANSFGNHFNLIIQNVTRSDAGRYFCLDPGSQERKEVYLTVLETQPVCKSNLNVDGLIGPNSCSIKPDIAQLSCSVRYIGNQVPELQWTKIGDNMTINSSICSDSVNIKTCNLTMETELQMEGNSYTCQTTQSKTRRYNCTSDVFRIIYVLGEDTELARTVGEKVNCSVNSSSQSCTSTWIFDNGTTNWTASHESVIEFKSPGRFICQADCVIGNKNGTFSAMTVNVSANTESPDNPYANETVEIFVGLSVAFNSIVIIVYLITFFYLRNKKGRRRQDDSHRRSLENKVLLNRVNAGETADEYINPGKIEAKSAKNHSKRVRGLTILNDELFVAFEQSNIIEVVSITSRIQFREFVVNGLMYPGTMAACAINSCLYVIDNIPSDKKKIFKFKPDGEVIKKWETDDDDYGRISVSDDGNVIMTVYDKHQMKIYSSDGNLLSERTIRFTNWIPETLQINFTKCRSETPITYIGHAINVNGGKFIICHGTYQSDIHRVCKINSKGKVLQSFGNKRGSDSEHLDSPVYLVEGNDGSILVADQKNHRIILLNSELEFETVLFTKEKDGVRFPEVIHIYTKTEPPLLFLGCNKEANSGGYVLVLKLEQQKDLI